MYSAPVTVDVMDIGIIGAGLTAGNIIGIFVQFEKRFWKYVSILDDIGIPTDGIVYKYAVKTKNKRVKSIET